MKFDMRHLAILSTLVIIFGSIIPLPNVSGGERTNTVAHLISYLICSFSWFRSLNSTRRYILLMAALTPLTEILQLSLPYRNPCIEDVVANSLGIILGLLISHLRHY